jgi:hypothetical protein
VGTSLFELTDLRGDAATLFFGATPPGEHQARWIRTIPARTGPPTFAFGPQQAAFDGAWCPGDFEAVTAACMTRYANA